MLPILTVFGEVVGVVVRVEEVVVVVGVVVAAAAADESHLNSSWRSNSGPNLDSKSRSNWNCNWNWNSNSRPPVSAPHRRAPDT